MMPLSEPGMRPRMCITVRIEDETWFPIESMENLVLYWLERLSLGTRPWENFTSLYKVRAGAVMRGLRSFATLVFAQRLQNRHASLYSTCFTEDPWSFQNLCPWIPRWHHCLLSLWWGKEECVQPQSQVALAEKNQLMAAYQSIVGSQGNCFLIKKKWFLLAELARLFATAIPTTPSWYGIVQPSGNWLKQISTCKLEWFKIT